jgi:hypothetical protein
VATISKNGHVYKTLRTWEGNGHGIFKALFKHSSGKPEANYL